MSSHACIWYVHKRTIRMRTTCKLCKSTAISLHNREPAIIIHEYIYIYHNYRPHDCCTLRVNWLQILRRSVWREGQQTQQRGMDLELPSIQGTHTNQRSDNYLTWIRVLTTTTGGITPALPRLRGYTRTRGAAALLARGLGECRDRVYCGDIRLRRHHVFRR